MGNKSFAASVLAASMLAAGTGCDQQPAQKQFAPSNGAQQRATANDNRNLFDTLSQYSFVGYDGQPVNMAGLRASLQNSHTTLSFGFAECQNYCPMINNVLGALGEKNPGITSIIIAANPEVDGFTPDSRAKFMQRVRDDGVKHNVVILYPMEGGRLSAPSVPKIAMATGAIVNASKPLDHSANVVLYGPGGQRLAEKSGLKSATDFVNEWTPTISGIQR